MADKRTHEYQIIRNDKDRVVGKVWWDGKKIQADSDKVLGMISGAVIASYSMKDGVKFLEKLPLLFKNGYVTAKKL